MIKMLGLIKQDMSPNQNEWAWYGYQVSMRILEVTLCTLLAIIATTPLRSESNPVEASPGSTLGQEDSLCCGNRKNRRRKGGICCFGDSNPPREFEDEIYSEICSNNHSVRQVSIFGAKIQSLKPFRKVQFWRENSKSANLS